MNVFLIRHAETDGNRTRYVGREDLPLNETGTRQARALAGELAVQGITAILSSPLQRARQTAAPLACRLGVDVEVRPGLVEIDFGALEGQPKDRMNLSLRHHHRHAPLPGGESLHDVWERLQPLAREVRERAAAGECLAIIGHYWSNRLFFDLLRGVSFDEALLTRDYKPANASAVRCAVAGPKAHRPSRIPV